jgi:ribosomal protein S18 acetylase RimI-like enzyme
VHAGAAEGLTIRQARLEDEDELLALDRATWSPLSSPAPGPPEGPFFNERTRPEDIWVAVRGSRALGYAKMQHPTELPASAHVWHCNGLAVDPAVQAQGVGRALMEALIAEARARGGRKFSLRVFAANERARRLYEGLGFELEGTLRGEFMVGEGEFVDDLLMALDLSR